MKVGILDYGAGNLASVRNGLVALGADWRLVTSADADDCTHLILPGVGGFGHAAKNLHASGLIPLLTKAVERERPLLGICLGMQLFFESSEESQGTLGLGFLPGQVVRIAPGGACKIPHMGWNTLRHTDHSSFEGLPENPAFYFVHSYHCRPAAPQIITAQADYGTDRLTAMVVQGNLWGAQCHPEKSGRVGMLWLKHFLEL